jgi:uncharacterized repeat protein (TIGR03847 family)
LPTPQHDLGLVSTVTADALGEPGQRRFRLTAVGPSGSVLLWLEKGQLQGLALSIHRVLAISPEGTEDPGMSAVSADPPRELDFRAGGITLEYDEVTGVFGIEAYEQGTDEIGPPMVRLSTNRAQAGRLAEEALEVCAAGRPLCPLCNAPLGEGVRHLCPATNGHRSN